MAVIEAPTLKIDFQQPPSSIKWRHITTEKFQIIFPEEIEFQAKKVAHLLEKSYPFVARSLEVAPPKIPVVLHNQSLISNGFVALAPRRSEWFVTPSVDPELSNTEWLKTLAIHEFRHVVQFHKTRQGFNKVLRFFFGEIGEAVGVGLSLPPWFLEGDAVGIETALTSGGRGRLPLFDRDLRALLLSGKNWSYDKAHLRSYDDYVPNHYVYGYFYTSWLRNEYGDLFLSKLADQSARDSWNPLSFYNASKRLTGFEFESTYEKIIKDLIYEWSTRLKNIQLNSFESYPLPGRIGWTHYLYPQLTPDGKIIALKRGLSFIDQFVVLDGNKEKSLFYPGLLQNEYPFKMRKGRLAYFEMEFDPRWGLRDFSRLKVFDYTKNDFILDKRGLKGRLAVIDHAGTRIAYVDWSEKQKQSIVVLSITGKVQLKLNFSEHEVITSLDWLDENSLALVVKDQTDLKEIIKLDIATEKKTELLKKGPTNIGFITSQDGHILFESPKSGIDNIWLIKAQGETQLTSSRFGAYAPLISNNKLIYNDYSVDGMNIVQKNLPWDVTQSSSGGFYPIYEKFSQSELKDELEVELLKKYQYESSPYSQVNHATNVHSWIILAPPLSYSMVLAVIGRDILNKLTFMAGTEYNFNERVAQGFIRSSWSHFYPVIDIGAAYGGRRQEIVEENENKNNTWEEGTFEVGVSVPWKMIHNRFIHSFSARAFSKLIKVTNKISKDLNEVNDGALLSPGLDLAYSFMQRLAWRDMNPPWGLMTTFRSEKGSDITGNGQQGELTSVDTRFYLPGFYPHHSFYHQLAYEKQNDEQYQYSSLISFLRGGRSFFLGEFTKYSGNYLFPVFYPDCNWSRYVYLKRISLNLFYDQLQGRYLSNDFQGASTGWESLFEMNLLRIFIPITIGVRGSYILQGPWEKSNYELFFTTQTIPF